MVGKNILEHPSSKNHSIVAPSRKEVDLLDYEQVFSYLEETKPELIIHAAGLVGGIEANKTFLFDFMSENLKMGLNVVKAARTLYIPKMINLGSTCMYPKNAPQPMKEEYLFTGLLEPTNEGYAIAKNAIQKACQYTVAETGLKYKTYIPCNLFGRWDHFDQEKSHLLPAIIRKTHEALVKLETHQTAEIEIWGTGTPRREFMDAADLADFIFYSLDKFDEVPEVINVSPGEDYSINEIYERTVKILAGEKASRISFSHVGSRSDGMFQKLSDITNLNKLGWKPKKLLSQTVSEAYEFLTNEISGGKESKMNSSSRRKIALITGVSGQDGSYLAELLLDKNYVVVGMTRRNSQASQPWLKSIFDHEHFIHTTGNMQDASSLYKILETYKPDEIYNLAAQSHVGASFECPEETFDVVAMGTLRLLNAAKAVVPRAKIYQAGSSEQFGFNPSCPQNENTTFMPASPYACAKVASHNICVNYRKAYDMFISVGILNNHESERRGEKFVTRKITKAAARIKLGKQDKLLLGNLDAKRDWGYAKEYVVAMWKMLQRTTPEDFVIATGESHSVKEFLEAVFEEAGLDYTQHVEFDLAQIRPHEVNHLEGNSLKAKELLGWEPKIKYKDLARLMYQNDLRGELASSLFEENNHKILQVLK